MNHIATFHGIATTMSAANRIKRVFTANLSHANRFSTRAPSIDATARCSCNCCTPTSSTPQTVLFLVYVQDGTGALGPDAVRVPMTTRGRTFFMKLGYAWRP